MIDRSAIQSGTTQPPDGDLKVRDRAERLFRFLAELASLRIRKIRDVADYPSIFWLKDLPQEPEVYSHFSGTPNDQEPWLRIDKPEKPLPVQPPDVCRGWYESNDIEDFTAVPRLLSKQKTRLNVNGSEETPGDAAQVQEAWDAYIRETWQPWQLAMERWERVQRCYRKLFAIHQEQERRGEQYELILGVGTLLCIDANGRRVSRPILTARVSLLLHPQTGRIELIPPDDGIEVHLEQDMLQLGEQPPKEVQVNVEAKARTLESLWDSSQVFPMLKEWFGALPLAADAHFAESLDFGRRASDVPQMAFAPLLILRKRQDHGILTAIKQVEESLRDGAKIPRGLRELCGEYRQHDGLDGQSAMSAALTSDEPLFPLPTNEQQRKILEKLIGRSAVLVQGPPGTGKSHTIVNLVCHFLAQGKRVLVTSETPRALRVLQDKFPAEVQPLVVSVLDEKEDSRRNLQRSVDGILRSINDADRDPTTLEKRISEVSERRTLLRAEISKLRRQQREFREADTLSDYTVPGTGYHGTPQHIAISLENDASRFEWLDDVISETAALPLTGAEVWELCELIEQIGPQFQDLLNSGFADPANLPLPNDFEEVLTQLAMARSASGLFRDAQIEAEWLAKVPSEQLRNLHELCGEWLRVYGEFSECRDWCGNALSDILLRKPSVWHSLSEQSAVVLEAIGSDPDVTTDPAIENASSVSPGQLLADAEDLAKHLSQGRGLGFWPFRAKIVRRTKYLWSQVRLDGRPCTDAGTVVRLAKYLRSRTELERIQLEWPSDVSFSTGTFRQRFAGLKEASKLLDRLLRLDEILQKVDDCFAKHKIEPQSSFAASSAHKLIQQVEAALAIQNEQHWRMRLANSVESIVQQTDVDVPHSSVTALRDAGVQQNGQRYRTAYRELAIAYQHHLAAPRCCELFSRLSTAVPRLANRLQDASERHLLKENLQDFEGAWSWKRAVAWLARYDADHSGENLRRKLEQRECEYLATTARLVADKSWLACLTDLARTPNRQVAMTAWERTVAKIGKGTGKHVEMHRRNARKYLQECWDAIPAHVMPLYRVAEQFKFDVPEMFDVVIVDEASQTGPEGLLLTFLAKQCIVVGDDKQISPEAGFVDSAAVMALIDKHIPDIPAASTLLPGTSLFDQIHIRHQTRLTLLEHFRCMPEIIRFSNDLCYRDTPLIPLRQYTTDRLIPLVDRFVIDGYREGTSERVINRPEAAAVAKAVVECLQDIRYRDKSFGVICLQGHAQSRLIEQMILERVGPDPFKDPKTHLLCGDAYSFQGDERDVIFLSMVAAADGDSRNGRLADAKYRQRFNVAASRARDQMWLFRSVRDSDLHSSCVRRRLVHFMSSNPELQAPTVNVEEIRADSHAHRHSERAPEPFDSWFEVDVFLALIDAGYRVLPQYPVAGKRIDLVVEDAQRRIAVECDGDEWHGPAEYEDDCIREAIIARCGWRFVRIRASNFYAQRSRAIEKLVDEIDSHGVKTWNPTECDATYSAVDVAEVSGAESLRWLGDHVADTAEESLSIVTVADAEASVDEVAGDSLIDAVDCAEDEASPAEWNGKDLTPAPLETEPDLELSNSVQQAPPLNVRLNEVLACLFQAKEPLTAGQIRWRTKISEEAWPEVERDLLQRNLTKKNGTGRRAKFGLLVELPAAASSFVGSNGEIDVVELGAETWFALSHWAKQNNVLEPWQRGLVYSLGRLKRDGHAPTEKQIRQGRRIWEQSRQLGFSIDGPVT